MVTVERTLRFAYKALQDVSETPDLDADRLLLHVLKKTESAWLYAHADATLTASQATHFQRLVAERQAGKPLAYILGEAEFYGRPFYVNEDVLIPRPETENLVTTALEQIQKNLTHKKPFAIADIGTGSGCIAITLALELTPTLPPPAGVLPLRKGEKKILSSFPSLRRRGGSPTGRDGVVIVATDISPKALAVAQKNAARHGVADRIEFLQGDMLEPLVGKQVDLIVSNIPYVPTAELASKPELSFEPHIALDGGPDGQKFIKQIKNSGISAVLEGTHGRISWHRADEQDELPTFHIPGRPAHP